MNFVVITEYSSIDSFVLLLSHKGLRCSSMDGLYDETY